MAIIISMLVLSIATLEGIVRKGVSFTRRWMIFFVYRLCVRRWGNGCGTRAGLVDILRGSSFGEQE